MSDPGSFSNTYLLVNYRHCIMALSYVQGSANELAVDTVSHWPKCSTPYHFASLSPPLSIKWTCLFPPNKVIRSSPQVIHKVPSTWWNLVMLISLSSSSFLTKCMTAFLGENRISKPFSHSVPSAPSCFPFRCDSQHSLQVFLLTAAEHLPHTLLPWAALCGSHKGFSY